MDRHRELFESAAPHYEAMVPTEALRGLRTANQRMSELLFRLPQDSRVLDAACGAGWDAIAIANGLPGLGPRRRYRVSINDASIFMLESARRNFQLAQSSFDLAIPESRNVLFENFDSIEEWRGRFDAVIVPNAINILPREIPYERYDDYLLRSLLGLRSVLVPGGVLLIDTRDWDRTVGSFQYSWRQNEHERNRYLTQYSWSFGELVDSIHRAEMRIFDLNKGVQVASEEIVFAGRRLARLEEIFVEARLSIRSREGGVRGLCGEPFQTYELANCG